MENRPLISETTNNTLEKKGFSKKLLGVCISILLIFGVFIGVYYNSVDSNSHSNNNNHHINVNNKNVEHMELQEDLPSTNENTIELAIDPGNLEIETFTNTLMVGKFDVIDYQQTLEFVFDGYSSYISLQLIDTLTNDVINSFYTKKTSLTDVPNYYTIDGAGLDVMDKDMVADRMGSFYSSNIPTSLIHLSMKVAAMGYTGNSAKSVRMLHAMAMHLSEMIDIDANTQTTIELNEKRLNDFYNGALDNNDNDKDKEELSSLAINVGIDNIFADEHDCDSTFDDEPCPTDCYQHHGCVLGEKCGNQCFGKCGRECQCWLWVCGNCDCNCLCYNHDFYCSCVDNKTYRCWAMWEWLDEKCN